MPENRKLSTAKKLVQAAALAAILVPLGSVMVETSTITCGLGSGSGGGCSLGGTIEGNKATFDFHDLGGNYLLSLEFDSVDFPFDISVEDSVTDQATLTGSPPTDTLGVLSEVNRLAGFPGYTCVPIVDGVDDGVDGCVEFIFGNGAGGPPPEPGDGWSGLYKLNIHWDADTNGLFPGDQGQIRVLHNLGADGGTFDEDLCSRFGCTYDPDPGAGTRGDGISGVLITSTAVPEPSSVLLVATGVGALYNVRRRRRKL